jgi:hypothetical protein
MKNRKEIPHIDSGAMLLITNVFDGNPFEREVIALELSEFHRI